MTRTIESYKNTNWKEFRETLDKHITINDEINDPDELDKELDELITAIRKATKQHVQRIKVKNNEKPTPDLIKQRNRQRRQNQRTGDATLRNELRRTNATITAELKKDKNERWKKTLENLKRSDNSIWKMAKAFKKRYYAIPPLNTPNGEAITDAEKAETLATHYEKIHDDAREENTP